MTHEEMKELVAHTDNKSEKIRILFRHGVERSDIYKFLGITYQHVQNVLKRSGLLEAPAVEQNEPPVGGEVYTVTVDASGRIALPAEYMKEHDISAGDLLICRQGREGLVIMSREAAADALRETLKQRMPGEAALLEALLARPRSS